jgi:D-hexose-6-phosphate mutarotase
VDTRDGGRRKRQDGVVVVDGEVDRVYLDTSGTCVVDDAVRGRRILLSQTGSRSTVVWNPWEEKARRMADFPDDAYRRMVCVEAVNTAGDAPVVEPGGRHTLTQTISVEPGP